MAEESDGIFDGLGRAHGDGTLERAEPEVLKKLSVHGAVEVASEEFLVYGFPEDGFIFGGPIEKVVCEDVSHIVTEAADFCGKLYDEAGALIRRRAEGGEDALEEVGEADEGIVTGRGLEVGMAFLDVVLQELDSEVFLGAKVVVEGSLRDFYRGEDLIQAHGVEAVFQHQLLSGIKNALFGGFFAHC